MLIPGGGICAQTVDLSTNEAVLAELQGRVDAKRDIPGKKGGGKLDAKHVCIERLKESAKVIIIGFFRYDYGCHFDGAFVDSRYLERTDAALSKNALKALGWDTANRDQRERLAKLWVEKGLVAFFTVLYTKDKNFQASTFQPPQVISEHNGEVVVTLWVRLPSGNRGGTTEKFLEYRFSNDGDLKL